jgi:MFS family permease
MLATWLLLSAIQERSASFPPPQNRHSTSMLKPIKNKNDNLYYALSVFMNLDVQRSLFVLYLLQLGITQGEVGILQSFLFFSSVVLEIPSGLLADRYGRKCTLIISFLGLCISGIGFLLFSSFVPFAIIFCLFGASIAMGSGSDRALLYDNLLAEHRADEYPKILSRARAIGAISLSLSMLLGGVIQDTLSWNGVYIFFAASKLIGAIIVVFNSEIKLPPISLNPNNANELNTTTAEGSFTLLIKFFSSNRGAFLIPLFVGYALFELSTIPLFIYGQPFFSQQGLEIPIIAGIYATVEIISAAMFMVAGYICSRFTLGVIAVTTTLIVTALLFTLSLNTGTLSSVAVFILIMSLPAIYETAYETYINENIESRIRASCLSVANLVNSIIIGISYTVFGGLLDRYGFSSTLIVVAGVCFMGLFFASTTLLISGQQRRKKSKKLESIRFTEDAP